MIKRFLLTKKFHIALFFALTLLLVGGFATTNNERKAYIVKANELETAVSTIEAIGGTVTHELGIIDSVGAELTAKQVDRLQQNPDILNVTANPELLVSSSGSPAGHNDFVQLTRANRLHQQGITGKDVTIAVVDTGYWPSDLTDTSENGQNRVLAQYDAINDQIDSWHDEPVSTDDNGHGAHITSILLGSRETFNRTDDGLVALYNFTEGTGNTIYDVSNVGSPLNLVIEDQNAVSWNDDSLSVNSETRISSPEAATKIIDSCQSSNELTIEAWVTPENTTQDGPARIVTISKDSGNRNTTLGQEGSSFDFRLRTTNTNNNGIFGFPSTSGEVTTSLTQLTVTSDANGNINMYSNGGLIASDTLTGDYSNWDGRYKLSITNEIRHSRFWKGEYHMVAIYCRALSADEVLQNFQAIESPAQGSTTAQVSMPRYEEGLVALYDFEEGSGNIVHDISGNDTPIDLIIEDETAVTWGISHLTIDSPTLIYSDEDAERLTESCQGTNELTVEAWVKPGNLTQHGPSRIVTLSTDTGRRNFTLGQDYAAYHMRLRTTKTGNNGRNIFHRYNINNSLTTELTQVTYTHSDSGWDRIFINGKPIRTSYTGGNFSNWVDNYQLAFANELTRNRPWLGELHMVAVYCKALDRTDVLQNYNAASDTMGISPEANLVSVKAFDASGAGRYMDVIRGIDWVVANKDELNIKVLNLSFSATPQSHYWDDPLNQAVMRAWQAGIVVVAAAGNNGPDPMTVGVPGNVPYVITVGAISDNYTPLNPKDDYLASFSSTGPTHEGFVKPDIVAPGGHILGILPKHAELAHKYPQFFARGDYFKMSGTSQATAVTSGVAALMLQANPELTPDDIKCRIMATSRPAINDNGQLAYSIFQQGAGLVNAYDAVNSSASGCANNGLNIAKDLSGEEHYGGLANLAPRWLILHHWHGRVRVVRWVCVVRWIRVVRWVCVVRWIRMVGRVRMVGWVCVV